jgi:Concanavalin A-like lectin/glucanases superfamily
MRGTLLGRRGQQTCYRLRLEGLEDRVNPAVDWSHVATGISSGLTAVQQTVHTFTTQSQAALPILGRSISSLSSQADKAMTDAAASLRSIFQKLQQQQNNGQAITEAGVKTAIKASPFVRDVTGNGTVDENDVDVHIDPVTGNVSVTVRIGEAVTVPVGQTVNFDLGLPGVPFKITGGSKLTASVDVDYSRLTFGLRNNGADFYAEAPGGRSLLAVKVGAEATKASMTGTIGFLQVKATPLPGQKPAEVSATLNLDANGLAISNPRMTGAAAVHLNLDAGFVAGRDGGPGLPHIATDFVMNWNLGGSSSAPQASLGGAPTVEFNNVKLGLGSYLGDQLRPIIETVQEVTLPLAPIHAFLAAPIPGLSDLGEQIPGVGQITLEKLAELAVAAHVLPPDYQLLAELAVNLHNLVKVIDDTQLDPKTNDPLVPMGNFSLGGNGDLRSPSLPNGQTFAQLLDAIRNGGDIPLGGLSALVPLAQDGLHSVQDKINEFLPSLPGFVQDKVRQAFTTMDQQLDRLQNGYGLKFPLIDDPANGVFRLLLGQDVDFARFDVKAYIPGIKESRDLDIWGPVKASFTGQMDLDLELHAGTDTYGLRQFFMSIARGQADPSVLDDGFYFEADKPLAEITNGSITAEAGAEISFGEALEFVAYPHLSGSLASDDFRVGFVDPNRDGDHKLRIFRSGEIGGQLFEVQGTITDEFKFAIDAGVRVTIPFTGITLIDGVKEVYSATFAQGTLLSFGDIDTTNPFSQANSPPPKVDVVFDTNFENGANDGERDTIVAQVSGTNLQLFFNGVLRPANVYPLNNVKSLTIIGSEDDSTITVRGQIKKPVTVDGGGGFDTLEFLDYDYTSSPAPVYAMTTTAVGRGTRSVLSSNPVLYDTLISYDEMESVLVRASNTGKNSVYADSLTVPTIVFGGQRSNNFYIGFDQHSIEGLGNNLTLFGGPGVDNLFVDDRVLDRHVNYEVDFDHLVRSTDVEFASTHLPNGFAAFQDFRQQLNYTAMDSVTLAAAGSGNSISVNTMNTNPFVVFGAPLVVTVYSGTGNDDVTVDATGGPVTIDGQAGVDAVTIGNAQNGTQNIGDAIRIKNQTGISNLTIDDRVDTAGLGVTMQTRSVGSTKVGTVNGMLPLPPGSPIFAISPSIDYDVAAVGEVSVLGGSGGNIFTVDDTATNVETFVGHNIQLAKTSIHAGSGDDIVDVLGTTGPLKVDGEAGVNQINIGGAHGETGNLADIDGPILLTGGVQPGTAVVIADDHFTIRPSRFKYTLDAQRLVRTSLTGTGPTGTIDFSGLSAGNVTIRGGMGANNYVFNGAPMVAPDGEVDLEASGRDDSVSVFGSAAPLDIDLGGGTSQSVQMGDATHSLDPIQAPVFVRGNGLVTANVSNAAATQSQRLALGVGGEGTTQTFRRSQIIGTTDVPLNSFTFAFPDQGKFNLQSGQNSDAVSVVGTLANVPVTLNGGPSADEFVIFADEQPLLGPITVVGQATDNDYSVFYDYRQPTPQTYGFQNPTGEVEHVDRTGMAPVTYQNMREIVLYSPLVGGSTINVTGSPADLFLNLSFGGPDVVNLGSKALATGGTLAGIRGAVSVAGFNGVTLNVDDSGNTDPTPRTVSFEPFAFAGDYGNHVEGLLQGILYWQMNNTATINIHTGAADDTFALHTTAIDPKIQIDGGGGINTLDYSAVPGVAGLVSLYHADGAATDAAGGHHGILQNGTTYAPGHDGQAFQFDGIDDTVKVFNAPNLEPQTVSVEMWVNGTTPDGYLLAKGANQMVASSYALYAVHGGMRFYVADAAGHFAESPDAGNGVWDGNWHHVVGTYDGSMVRLYVDGVQIGNGTPTTLTIGYYLPVSNDLTIGTYNGIIPFKGLIDDAAVYSRALTPEEIQNHFQGNLTQGPGVTVSLPAGTATGLRGGIARIQKMIGSSADDVLVGTGGSTLTGRAGRDVLIAGTTAGSLLGGAGDDLLIGGTTAYDMDTTELNAIRAVWSRTDLDYATRETTLRNGLLAGPNVMSNGQVNTLTGDADRDLFFGTSHDSIVLEPGEDLVPV